MRNTPPEQLSALQERLAVALEHQEDLVDEVVGLRTSQRILRRLIWVVLTVALLSLGTGFIAVQTALDVSDAQDAVTENTVETCKVRNATPRNVRESLTAAFDTLEDIVGPESVDAVNQLRETVQPAEKTDKDCNGDGLIDSNDYPDGLAPVTPIVLDMSS